MSSLNAVRKPTPVFTAEGARGFKGNHEQQLRRLALCCMLWEDNFYIDGQKVADLIAALVHTMPMAKVAEIAIEAREQSKLRHLPLLLVRELARHPALTKSPRVVSETLARVIQRPDELTEFLSIYWKDGKCPLSKQVKLGLAQAFAKFNEYSLAKYNRKGKDVSLKDVLFLCHSKPADLAPWAEKWDKEARRVLAQEVEDQVPISERVDVRTRPDGFTPGELLYGKLIYDQLETPDTWEVELSAGKDKKETFTRLMTENKLGDLAFLRNLRNMVEAGVPVQDIWHYGENRRWGRVLPFRFIAAARVVPHFEPHLEQWMLRCLADQPKLAGTTALLIDVSGSMFGTRISAKSDLDRFDAAAALAILGRELCERARVYSFSSALVEVPPRRGFALRDALYNSQYHGGTRLGLALTRLQTVGQFDRIIVLTDEQSADVIRVVDDQRIYVINVASAQNGVASQGRVERVSGWSEAVFDFIQRSEK